MKSVAWLFALLILVVGVGASTPANAQGAPCDWGCHVGSDPAREGYVGSILLPPGASGPQGSLAESAAHCPGCRWQLLPACRTGPRDAFCVNARGGCPPPKQRTAIWLQRPGEAAPQRVGLFCRTPGEPLTPAEYLPAVRDRFEKLLPPLTVTYQPNGRGLVNLAVVFATHQPTSLGHPHFILAGHLVDLTATPRWTVDFGDGQFGTYARPGGAYPDADLAHTYDHPGTFRVTVTATWVGQFSVDGLGPFAVDGPDLTQRQSVTVPVKEARAVLVG